MKKTPCLSIEQILLSLQQTVEEILGKQIERLNIDAKTFQAIQNTLDTEWDRLCAKVLSAASLPEQKIKSVGIKPDTVIKGIERVITVLQEKCKCCSS